MKIKELIAELQKYDGEIELGLVDVQIPMHAIIKKVWNNELEQWQMTEKTENLRYKFVEMEYVNVIQLSQVKS
jgi:hypothetical protein